MNWIEPPESRTAEYLWRHVIIARTDAYKMMDGVQPTISPWTQKFSLSDEQIREGLALTLATMVTLQVGPVLERMSDRLKKAIIDLKNARDTTPIMRRRAPQESQLLAYIFALDDAKGSAQPAQKGRPKKEFRDLLAARLIGFLEFASGQMVNPTSDIRAEEFLLASLKMIGDDFRRRKDPRYNQIGKSLDLPTTTRFVIQNAKQQQEALLYAARAYGAIVDWLYLSNPITPLL